MLVSFIIIAYNAENVIENCLKSLKSQDYDHKKIEVILVDSASNDNTKKKMMDFKKENENDFENILVLDNPKKTLPCGWNVALENSKGEAILRVDAHSTFNEDFIRQNVLELENGENIVGGHRISVASDNSLWKKTLLLAEQSLFGSGIAKYRREEKREYVSTLAHAMYRKKVFDEVGKYNEILARTEDNEMHYRMKQKGYKFLLSPNIVSYHHARNTFKGMMKQKYENGKWIGITLKYCPKCFSIYHFIPMFFVLGILFSLLMYFTLTPIFIYMISSLYLLFNLINLISVFIKEGIKLIFLIIPFILFSLHISYGVGTIFGISKSFFMKK